MIINEGATIGPSYTLDNHSSSESESEPESEAAAAAAVAFFLKAMDSAFFSLAFIWAT